MYPPFENHKGWDLRMCPAGAFQYESIADGSPLLERHPMLRIGRPDVVGAGTNQAIVI